MQRRWGVAFSFLFVFLTVTASADSASGVRVLSSFEGDSLGLAVNKNGLVVVDLRLPYTPRLLREDEITQYTSVWDPQTDSLRTLNPLAGFTAANGVAINSHGEVAGFSERSMSPSGMATLWNKAGTPEKLPNYGDDWGGRALGMSDSSVVGYCYGDGNRPVVWTRTASGWDVEELPRTAHIGSRAHAISPNGRIIVGQDSGRPTRWMRNGAGKWEGTRLTETYGVARAVNDDGSIAGDFSETKIIGKASTAVREGFYLDAMGSVTRLGFPKGHHESEVTGMNSMGVVIGNSRDAHDTQAFIWSKSKGMRRLNLTSQVTHIYGINDKGIAVGSVFPFDKSDAAAGTVSLNHLLDF